MSLNLLLLLLSLLQLFGPGMHIREGNMAFKMLKEQQPEFAALDETPFALGWLNLGANGPDFENFLSSVKFGHSRELSYHLIDASADQPGGIRLFALGHLMHNSSDVAADGFVIPTLFASGAIGMTDLKPGGDDQKAEAETIVDVFGDLAIGDWYALVDVAFDFWLDGPEAQGRMKALVDWYCKEAGVFYKTQYDCDAIYEEIGVMAGKAAGAFNNMDRAAAKAWVKLILGHSLKPAAEFAFGGTIMGLIGKPWDGTPEQEKNLDFFLATPMGQRDYWEQTYLPMDKIGPNIFLDLLAQRPPASAWPNEDRAACYCGNLVSMMNYLPELYATVPGILVDKLEWLDEAGARVMALAEADQGKQLRLRLRLYSALPFDGQLMLKVRKDAPGIAADGDALVAEKTLAFAYDPDNTTAEARKFLELEFAADLEGAVGLYAELWKNDAAGPMFSTSVDALLAAGILPMNKVPYTSFDSYLGWPGSLPVTGRLEQDARLLVGTSWPAGFGPMADVTISLEKNGEAAGSLQTGSGGTVFLEVSPGDTWAISATRKGFGYADQTVQSENRLTVVSLVMHPHSPPKNSTAWTTAGTTLEFAWDTEVYAGCAASFKLGLEDYFGKSLTELVESSTDGLETLTIPPETPDKTSVIPVLYAVYTDGTTGPRQKGPRVMVDSTGPVVESCTRESFDCEVGDEGQDAFSVIVIEGGCPVVALAYAMNKGQFQETEILADKESGDSHTLEFAIPCGNIDINGVMVLKATNGIGLSGQATFPIATPPEADVTADTDTVETGDAAEDAVNSSGGGGSCAMTDTASVPASLLALFLLLALRTRRASAGRNRR